MVSGLQHRNLATSGKGHSEYARDAPGKGHVQQAESVSTRSAHGCRGPNSSSLLRRRRTGRQGHNIKTATGRGRLWEGAGSSDRLQRDDTAAAEVAAAEAAGGDAGDVPSDTGVRGDQWAKRTSGRSPGIAGGAGGAGGADRPTLRVDDAWRFSNADKPQRATGVFFAARSARERRTTSFWSLSLGGWGGGSHRREDWEEGAEFAGE